MSRYVFDIETNHLLKYVTKLWIIVLKDIDTNEVHKYVLDDFAWRERMEEASLLIGHNILGFDLPALEKLFGWTLPKTVNLHDTLIMSQVQNYKRFGNDGHSLRRWGEFFGFPKGDFTDFSVYIPEMLDYCITDVELSHKVYLYLLKELRKISEQQPYLKHYLRAEHAVAKFCAAAELHGWPFDVEAARALFITMSAELESTTAALEHKLGIRTVAVDKCKGVVPAKEPKWVNSGKYAHHTANWFKIDPTAGLELTDDEVEYLREELDIPDLVSRPIAGPYCRVEFKPLKLSSVSDVKLFLFRAGWQPTDWNYKMNEVSRRKEKTSPKITEDSLEFLGGDGKLYLQYLTTKSRYGILNTWLEEVDENGRLHGEVFTIGTPSMRMRHKIIVNVPSADSVWGAEMRALFGCLPGHKVVGCDSSGNQARGLAHYLEDQEFIDLILNGDVHTYNAQKMTEVLQSMGIDHVVSRSASKRILYAFLFGASGGKLWSYIFSSQDVEKGNKFKNGFVKAVPGFKNLVDKLEATFSSTKKYGEGYIIGIAGNRVYVDSYHKLLVYLLQACEKATCSAALMLTVAELEERDIPYQPLIFMHDEFQIMVPEEYAEDLKEIGVKAFQDGPKLFGIEIMDGEGDVGNNWLETH